MIKEVRGRETDTGGESNVEQSAVIYSRAKQNNGGRKVRVHVCCEEDSSAHQRQHMQIRADLKERKGEKKRVKTTVR